jgi:hypothetical protein
MDIKLKQIKNIIGECCVTIICNTHRTHPENKQDALTVKNLIKEAKERIFNDEHKRYAKVIETKLDQIESTIDHNHNLDSLIIFVNEDIAEYVKLPIKVEDRVVIDHTFATRDLIRSLHLETHYYLLLLSQSKVRLLECFNDSLVKEIGDAFPINNNQFYSTSGVKQSNASKETNLIAEFFNRVDKEVNKVRKENPLPVLICTEIGNYHEYLKIADQKNTIYDTFLNKNRVEEKDHDTVKDAWEIVKEYTIQKNNERKTELLQAVGANKFLSDINDIWKAIMEGRVQTIFIEQGLFQPAKLVNNHITFVSDDERNQKEIVDDIYDEMIEMNMDYGGEVVFLPKGELEKFDGVGAITRW